MCMYTYKATLEGKLCVEHGKAQTPVSLEDCNQPKILFIYHLSVVWVAMFNTATDTTDYMLSLHITTQHDDGGR
jgi:hypothetical protein